MTGDIENIIANLSAIIVRTMDIEKECFIISATEYEGAVYDDVVDLLNKAETLEKQAALALRDAADKLDKVEGIYK